MPLSEDISQGFDVSVATEVQRKGIGSTLFELFKKQNPDYPTGGLTKAGRGMLEKVSRESGGKVEDFTKMEPLNVNLEELDWLKSKNNEIEVYRGGPYGKGDFQGVFVSKSEKQASQYGDVKKYKISSNEKLLDYDSPEAKNLIERFKIWSPEDAGYTNSDEDFFMFPSENFKMFLEDKGYSGTSFGDDIFLFNKKSLRKNQ